MPAGLSRPISGSTWPVALVFAAVAALLMPRQSAFPYSFQAGQPWTYHALKAPFDFEVLYPEEQVRPAVDRIKAEHGPYFLLDNHVSRQQKQQFVRLLEDQLRISGHDAQYDDLRANAGIYLSFGQQMLDLLFTRGITDPHEPAFQATPGYVFVVAGNNERRVPVRDLLTVKSARNYLTDTLPYAPLRHPELVLPMLEKVIIPNLRASDSMTIVSLRRKMAAAMSTGVSVQRGETIVQRNELISPDTQLKLLSLARRYETPQGWESMLGYGLLAALAFGVFCSWFAAGQVRPDDSQVARLLPPVLALLGVLGVGFGSQVGLAVPLLLPFWVLPLLLRPAYGPAAGLGVWGVVLTTVSLDWSAGWLVVQTAGLAGALIFLSGADTWGLRAKAVLAIALLQTLVGLAAGGAGKIPDALWTTDSSVFLFAAAAFALLAFPLGDAIHQGIAKKSLH